MSYSIPLFELNFDENEERAMLEVLRSRWISTGPRTAELEATFARHIGVKHAIALSNCTAALHLALAALGVGPGDEVIVPSLTFVATVNAVGYVGATPVFADVVGAHDLSIDPAQVERLITPRTKVILPMHYAGFACDMGALGALARGHGLKIVEDAAHAPDSYYGERRLGSLGDVNCFSFFSNKNVSCGEGGMITTDSDALAAHVRLMRSHGMTTMSYDRAKGHATAYDVVARGYNYRMDDMRSALVLEQLKKLARDTQRRGALRAAYVERLRGVEGLTVPYLEHRHPSSNYIFPVVLNGGGAARRDAIRNDLGARGIQTSVHYPAVHRFSIYRERAGHLPRTEHVADHEITLPLFGSMTMEQLEQVTAALVDSLARHA